MQQQELIPHLFRSEFSKITAVLGKHLGFEHIDIAEDIASDTFLTAYETWPYKGIPENPAAWLYVAAKNKARNYIRRNKLFNQKISAHMKSDSSNSEEIEIDMSDKSIRDGQLQMLFAICHPSIPVEAQIGLSLRILCGFGIDEIANAFLTTKETINKRLFRAKEKLRTEKVQIEFPPEQEMVNRLETVLITLYLLFNEGYYSESDDAVIKEDLCTEAMRLTLLLIEHEKTNLPEINALYSLMCFHSSRFAARKNENGEIILYNDQDQSLWNKELIARGAYYLNKAAQGNNISTYHLEAGIAYWHTQKTDSMEKWENILQLYNRLLQIQYSPVAALNRAFAISKIKGKQAAIAAAEKLNLISNRYYFTLLGELYTDVNDETAELNFKKAFSLAKTKADRRIIQTKIDQLLQKN